MHAILMAKYDERNYGSLFTTVFLEQSMVLEHTTVTCLYPTNELENSHISVLMIFSWLLPNNGLSVQTSTHVHEGVRGGTQPAGSVKITLVANKAAYITIRSPSHPLCLSSGFQLHADTST